MRDDKPADNHAALARLLLLLAVSGAFAAGCGGGGTTGGGPTKTYLSVEASDPDGDALHYQWRVTAGTIDNRDSKESVWSMPVGPGLHFAYVIVSDGKGGYVERQYAVSTDALDVSTPVRPSVNNAAPAVAEFDGAPKRLTVTQPIAPDFAAASAAPAGQRARALYMPDTLVRVLDAGNALVASGTTDLYGRLALAKLPAGTTYKLQCRAPQSSTVRDCGTIAVGSQADAQTVVPVVPVTQNLRLYGHLGLSDGSVCGIRNAFAGLEVAASVQLQRAADGSAVTNVVRVNAYGDYSLDAAVGAQEALKLQVRCESLVESLDVPSPGTAGYRSDTPVELSKAFGNAKPGITRVIANGPDGNVRGQMVVPVPEAPSNALPRSDLFLTYKGEDSRLSACMYYRSIGAVGACDAQGNASSAISFDDWKREHKLKPFNGSNAEISATYINKADLNLVRRMVATQAPGGNDTSFYVCNHPGPVTQRQQEVEQVIDTALNGEKQVACVAMSYSVTPGTNGNQPFTKFYTFAPDGSLLPSINLDGRGEKYMPGACVACHGGSQYKGRFAEAGQPSPNLGATFLPFDTNNFLFSTRLDLTEAAQSQALHDLNTYVQATQPTTATSDLINGWYDGTGTTLKKDYVPRFWATNPAPGAKEFYRQVIGTSCRTCHVAMAGIAKYDWDTLAPPTNSAHVCGGTAALEDNASMTNALASYDELGQRLASNPALADLMKQWLGCSSAAPDPGYARR